MIRKSLTSAGAVIAILATSVVADNNQELFQLLCIMSLVALVVLSATNRRKSNDY